MASQYANLAQLAANVRATARRDGGSGELTFDYTSAGGVHHQVWYPDARAIAARMRLGLAAGLQVGLWRLGNEDQRLWSTLPTPLADG